VKCINFVFIAYFAAPLGTKSWQKEKQVRISPSPYVNVTARMEQGAHHPAHLEAPSTLAGDLCEISA